MLEEKIITKKLRKRYSKAQRQLTKSKNMMNEIFSFIDGNTVIHKLRLINKACNNLLRELGPMQT